MKNKDDLFKKLSKDKLDNNYFDDTYFEVKDKNNLFNGKKHMKDNDKLTKFDYVSIVIILSLIGGLLCLCKYSLHWQINSLAF